MQASRIAFLATFLTGAWAWAVPNVADFNTFHFKYFDGSSCPDADAVQWGNYNGWKDEMDDIATSYVDPKDTTVLTQYLTTTARNPGLDADLVAISTHGSDGVIYNKACGSILMSNIEPLDAELEIYLIQACDTLPGDREANWYTLGNMHRFGAVVTATCWDHCESVETFYTSTWNEIGDSIADSHQTIWNAWKDAYQIGLTGSKDAITIQGLGRIGAANCDDRAEDVTWQNRNDYFEYTYAHDRPYGIGANDYEFCGYYFTEI